MISFCTLCMHCKFEFGSFVEALAYHNRHINFEICVCHDDRAIDGSGDYLDGLADQYPFIKIIRNTKEQTIQYLDKLIDWYGVRSIFTEEFRQHLKSNLGAYAAGLTSDLWIGLGYLYNKAASIAQGDILLFAPGDYIWTMDMNALEAYVIANRSDGLFYGKFSGLMEPLTNEPIENIKKFLFNPPRTLERNANYYPCTLQDLYLLDYDCKQAYPVGDLQYPGLMLQMCQRLKGDSARFAEMHHGTHLMTRKIWNIIGGFTEEFYGRAWPDDKMNAHAMRLFWNNSSTLPIEFAFNFVKTTPWNPFYLHSNYIDIAYTRNINATLDHQFSVGPIRGREAPILRLV